MLCDRASLSYAQLNQRVGMLAALLSDLGVRPGMTVACAGQGHFFNLLLLHALPRLGCAFLPLDSSLPQTRLLRFIELAGADRLIAEDSVFAGLPDNCEQLVGCFSEPWLTDSALLLEPVSMPSADAAAVQDYQDASLPGDQLHWLIPTSGTVAEGKLVVLTGDQLMSSVRASRGRLAFSRADVWLMCLPMFHVGGLMIPLRCAEVGAALVLHERFDPVHVWEDLHQHQVTHLSLVPAMLARLLERYPKQSPPPCLRVLLIGGGALSTRLAQAALNAGWPLCPSYGMTETASQVATLYPPPTRYTAGLVGRPLSHLQVKIEPVSGRIMVRGGSVMNGYAGQAKREHAWFVTSDLGVLDEQGNLSILGRADDVLITGGENVHPQQVEDVLMACPGVEDVGVIGVPDPVWGDRLVALYSGNAAIGELQAWSRLHLPGFMRPKEYLQLDELPRTRMGKLQRNKLPELK